MKTCPKTLRKKLRKIANQPQNSLRKEVAMEALERGLDGIVPFFHDLLSHGCASGMIGGLIYYTDTHDFFDEHYREIEQLREEWTEMVGEPFIIKGDMKNYFAWFAFEETAYRLANELGIEV